MKKIFYFVAASLLMTSCLEDRAIEAYNEDFVNLFGKTDPLHTWKMVENQSVEVSLDKPSRVKIYVKAGNAYRLAADYENVSGTRTLSYDAPAGCEDIHVTVNGSPYQRGNARSESQGAGISTTATYKTFTYNTIETFYNNFRKDGNLLPEKGDNTGNVTFVDYKFKSNGGTYTFYPIYWGGIFHHNYGLYYYEGGTKKEISFITDHKAGALLQRKNVETDAWENVSDDYAYDYFFTGDKSYQSSDEILRSLCYNIHLPEGTEFGFYVDIIHELEDGTKNNRGRYYSDPELNTNSPISTFAYLQKDAQSSYITVEDYDDNDYNDFIFVLEGAPTPVVNDPIKYIYAVEDLGGENDFDFNDIVFSVAHITGHEEAIVQPLAAGGIYEAVIRFNGNSCGEIHGKFGKPSSEMVNTAKGTTKNSMVKANPFKVNVGTGWSHAAYGNSGNGFSVEVNIPNRVDKKITTYEPGTDVAPQMLVLSENWLWPTERTRISDAYSEFLEWGANYSITNWDGYYDQTNSWVSKHTDGKVVNWK